MSLIEKVAEGIYEAFRRRRIIDGGTFNAPWAALDSEGRAYWLEVLAPAAVAAMREPPPGLVLGRAGSKAIFQEPDAADHCAGVVEEGWKAMIDAALSDPLPEEIRKHP